MLFAAWGAALVAACVFPDYTVERGPDHGPPSPLNRICSDGETSEAETGIDCGGGCSPCREGGGCKDANDCVTISCVDGVCRQPTCNDSIKNGSETDRDCGGQCPACRVGGDCRAAADCQSGVCDAALCQPASCTDLSRNGDETSTDCGGSCPACGLAAACLLDADCASARCSEQLCVDPRCTDGLVNGDESGVDCGGPECAPCGGGTVCTAPSDCSSASCESGQCVDASCDDGLKNGSETATDCGGSCSGCAELGACTVGSDCASGACQSALCVPAAPTGMALSRMGWTAKASSTHQYDVPADVLDGTSNYWSNAALQQPGMFFEIDMGKVQTFFSVAFECQVETDHIGRFDLYLSSTEQLGAPARRNITGFPATTVEFATAQVARYVRIQVSAPRSEWWCIAELNVYR